jgi:hypothetical protein
MRGRKAFVMPPDACGMLMEFPDGARPPTLGELARTDARLAGFLRRLGPLVQDGFDPAVPGSLEAFNRRALLPLA